VTYYSDVEAAAEAIRPLVRGPADVAVVLGSGLGAVADALETPVSLAYERIPGWPAPSTLGHEGRLFAGRLSGRTAVMLSGRAHAYEGYDLRAITFGIRVLGRLGVRVLVLTNAAGGIRADLTVGSLVVVDDHLNLTGRNPLVGPNDDRFGPRFPDMTEPYSRRLRDGADAAGRAMGIETPHGVYAWVTGPSYETPAEIRWLRAAGADLVGMSTVPEVIVARHMNIEVLAISCVTNLASGLHSGALDHRQVLAVTGAAGRRLGALVSAVIERL
jgi:purine-nucleoside phosphorylase